MLVVGIAGGTGSGKTTVVEKIIKRFHPDHVVVLPQDSYYKDNSHLPLEKRQSNRCICSSSNPLKDTQIS